MKTKGKLKIRINKGKLLSRLVMLFALLIVINVCVGCTKYPEQYFTTWKYQLKNDLANGNVDAINYYNSNYVAKGKYLFGEDKTGCLNFAVAR